ncbi:hypothetical protein [Shewanella xiamenensis]
MNSPERMPAETHKPFTGYLWGALAVLGYEVQQNENVR